MLIQIVVFRINLYDSRCELCYTELIASVDSCFIKKFESVLKKNKIFTLILYKT